MEKNEASILFDILNTFNWVFPVLCIIYIFTTNYSIKEPLILIGLSVLIGLLIDFIKCKIKGINKKNENTKNFLASFTLILWIIFCYFSKEIDNYFLNFIAIYLYDFSILKYLFWLCLLGITASPLSIYNGIKNDIKL
ncbi:hypothetical protein [Aliarcobacter butzleri]|uniref:hypothetical protein n=1 Tax=Aliarcobacter butzleri TaxID=28197 RepID=UPI001269CC3E|nr:hypothetical protein [Aliarcobacter butzleri]